MRTSAAKPTEKWLDQFVQMSVDSAKIRINLSAEAVNHAQTARQMPEPRHSVPKTLDRDAKQRQDVGEGFLLGKCRFILLVASVPHLT